MPTDKPKFYVEQVLAEDETHPEWWHVVDKDGEPISAMLTKEQADWVCTKLLA